MVHGVCCVCGPTLMTCSIPASSRCCCRAGKLGELRWCCISTAAFSCCMPGRVHVLLPLLLALLSRGAVIVSGEVSAAAAAGAKGGDRWPSHVAAMPAAAGVLATWSQARTAAAAAGGRGLLPALLECVQAYLGPCGVLLVRRLSVLYLAGGGT